MPEKVNLCHCQPINLVLWKAKTPYGHLTFLLISVSKTTQWQNYKNHLRKTTTTNIIFRHDLFWHRMFERASIISVSVQSYFGTYVIDAWCTIVSLAIVSVMILHFFCQLRQKTHSGNPYCTHWLAPKPMKISIAIEKFTTMQTALLCVEYIFLPKHSI